jgi:hypothetical protein
MQHAKGPLSTTSRVIVEHATASSSSRIHLNVSASIDSVTSPHPPAPTTTRQPPPLTVVATAGLAHDRCRSSRRVGGHTPARSGSMEWKITWVRFSMENLFQDVLKFGPSNSQTFYDKFIPRLVTLHPERAIRPTPPSSPCQNDQRCPDDRAEEGRRRWWRSGAVQAA